MWSSPVPIARAAALAGVFSGVPSSLHAFTIGMDPLESSHAAGSILRPNEPDGPRLLLAGLVTHAALSFGWTAVMSVLPVPRSSVRRGAVAGLSIAALDLTIAEYRFPRVAALPRWPQVADHVLFGVLASVALKRSAVGMQRR